MKKVLVSLVAVLVVVTAAQGALTYSQTSAPTTPGGAFPPAVACTTYQLTVSESNGMWPVGITIAIGDGVTLVNQINPMAQATIFADNNPFIVGLGGFVDQDSQFPYLSVAGPTQQVVPSPACSESGVALNGDFAFLGGTANALAGPNWLVAQVVLPVGVQVPFSATVVEYDPATNAMAATLALNGFVGIPEPATMALLAIGGLGVLLRRKR